MFQVLLYLKSLNIRFKQLLFQTRLAYPPATHLSPNTSPIRSTNSAINPEFSQE